MFQKYSHRITQVVFLPVGSKGGINYQVHLGHWQNSMPYSCKTEVKFLSECLLGTAPMLPGSLSGGLSYLRISQMYLIL